MPNAPDKIGVSRARFGVDTERKYDLHICLDYLKTRIAEHLQPGFEYDDDNLEFYRQLVYYFHGDARYFDGDINKGLLITGHPGTGKTFALKIFRYYRNVDQIHFFVNSRPVQLKWDTYRSRELVSQFTNTGWDGLINSVCTRKVICIDDVGEEENAVHYGNNVNLVQEIIERRYTHPGLTFLITNLTLAELKERYGERVISRMHEMLNPIELKGPDRRKTNKSK